MDAYLKLTKAKSQLTSKHPYFGMLASRLKHEENLQIEYFVSNGVRFIYNPNYIETLDIDELFFILTNCVMHHILAHSQRKLNRKGALWQLATDYAINNMLHKNKLKIPKGANFNKEYKNMYSEEIYEILKVEFSDENGTNSFDDVNALENFIQQKDGNDSIFKNIKNMENEKIEDEWDYAQSIAKEVANKKSLTPLGLERFAKKMKASDIDWKFELYNAINRHMRNNYAFMPPNKKHIYRGVALPSLTSDTLSLVVAIDTSGSIREDILGAFIGEFKTIMQNFPAVAIELIIADAKVHSHYSFQGGEEMDFALKGGGGTDYRPTFEFVEANLPMSSMLLYFTDGEGIFPRIPPAYEVLWALSQNKNKIPFGRKIVIFD
ncbi:MAG: VWA-like domain-containing protein [Campylobacterota bacterium]|nr:VWA-like domain-containing protein [Campylobacterota bacterium]